MSATTTSILSADEWREVDQREGDGFTVTLKHHSQTGALMVSVRDASGEAEDLDVLVSSSDDAYHAFKHPYGYAARGDVVAFPPERQRQPLRSRVTVPDRDEEDEYDAYYGD